MAESDMPGVGDGFTSVDQSRGNALEVKKRRGGEGIALKQHLQGRKIMRPVE